MHHFRRIALATCLLLPASTTAWAAPYRLVGWNNLGMHCMDAEFSLFSLLPPFNSIQAQLIDPNGNLVTSPAGIQVTYQAVTDPDGSINTTSLGKTDFWNHEDALFGISLPVDAGLAGFAMPGAANVPQPMRFDAASSQFLADGIPITPYDDGGAKNTYPMMRLVARGADGTVLAQTDIVLPVSDEMSCSSCHASGSSAEAKPDNGWAWNSDPERDVRLNVLRLHDRRLGDPTFTSALADLGMNAGGLEATAVTDGRSVLCASCHLSEALPGSGRAGIAPLTQAMHRSMAGATDPATGMALDDTANRTACYTCHPGSATRCLRGAMGAAVAEDGTLAMQCQSCHGGMQDVGSPLRTGWLDEPRCESCHTGTATHNNGQIRYDSVFSSPGIVRTAVDDTFATNDDTPAPGISLYRFSTGHGGLQCSACHGSTHAIFPSSHASDNVQNIALQGHEGTLSDCGTCHASVPTDSTGGPHGMHPIGNWWVIEHHDYAEHYESACKDCHGTDYRGTVLSRALGDRSFPTKFGTKNFFRGAQIGCYACHAGPGTSSRSNNHPPVAQNASATTTVEESVAVGLVASDSDGNPLTLRIVSQPDHGTVGLSGNEARYFPDGVFTGTETFTFAAWDGSIDSNLGTVTVSVETSTPSTTTTTITTTTTEAPTTTTTLPDACGNGMCEVGESCTSCPADCVSGTGPGAVCGNALCEAADGEDCASCPQDCAGKQDGRASKRYCCGDGGGDRPIPCSDPRCTTSGWSCTDTPAPTGVYCCGDGVCDAAESCGTCALDCATGAEHCGNGSDDDCDGAVDCADVDCATAPACVVTCLPSGTTCSAGVDCCSGVCEPKGKFARKCR